ncbi:MAG: hypothetical protein ACXVPC_06840 [Tumebacillaceae bacterium]
MKIVSIEYPSALWHVVDIYNDNIDVFVTLEDGFTYVMVVTTPLFMLRYMDQEGLDYIPAAPPQIVVRSLTEENIRKAIETYAENNAYWLKLHHVSNSIPMEVIQSELDEITKVNAESDLDTMYFLNQLSPAVQTSLSIVNQALLQGNLDDVRREVQKLEKNRYPLEDLYGHLPHATLEKIFTFRKQLNVSHQALDNCIEYYLLDRTRKIKGIADDAYVQELLALYHDEHFASVTRSLVRLVSDKKVSPTQLERLLTEPIQEIHDQHWLHQIEDKLLANEPLNKQEYHRLMELNETYHVNIGLQRNLFDHEVLLEIPKPDEQDLERFYKMEIYRLAQQRLHSL